MLTSNYFQNGPWVLPWYNLGLTQFLRHGHNKLMIVETQCSQGYQKLVEKLRLRNFLIKVAWGSDQMTFDYLGAWTWSYIVPIVEHAPCMEHVLGLQATKIFCCLP